MFQRILKSSVYVLVALLFTATHQNTLSYQKTVDAILPLETVAWSPDGTRIAIGGGGDQCSDLETHSILIIDAITQQILMALQGHKCAVVNVAWSPDGSMLVSGSVDGTGRVWDMTTGDESSRSTECVGLMTQTSQVWSPDGSQIADFCDGSHQIHVWDVLTGDMVATYQASDFINSISWQPEGTQIAIGTINAIELIDAHDIMLQSSFTLEAGSITAMDWSPDDSQIAFASANNKIRILDVLTGDIHSMVDVHTDFVVSLVWNPDGTYLASASLDGSIRVWNATDGQQQAIVQSLTGRMKDVGWSPDGSQIVYVGVGIEGEPLQIMTAAKITETTHMIVTQTPIP